MNETTILVGGGILFLFFAIIGYIIFPKLGMGPPLTKWARTFLIITGIILLVIGIKDKSLLPLTIPSQSTILPEIKIISPKDKDEVSVKNEVSVNFSGKLPEEQYMWVVVNPVTSPLQWWPQGGIEPSKGTWIIKATFGTEKQDIGDKFNIAVILVNEKDDQYYKEYLKKGQETGAYPPLPLPNSARIIDKITVTRK